jgi:hypothetical protein
MNPDLEMMSPETMLLNASILMKPRRDPATWLMTPPHPVDVEKARRLREMAAGMPDEEE